MDSARDTSTGTGSHPGDPFASASRVMSHQRLIQICTVTSNAPLNQDSTVRRVVILNFNQKSWLLLSIPRHLRPNLFAQLAMLWRCNIVKRRHYSMVTGLLQFFRSSFVEKKTDEHSKLSSTMAYRLRYGTGTFTFVPAIGRTCRLWGRGKERTHSI